MISDASFTMAFYSRALTLSFSKNETYVSCNNKLKNYRICELMRERENEEKIIA